MGFENPENWRLIYVHKIGENQVLLTARLSDRDGPVDLQDYTVTLNISKAGSLVVDNADCNGDSAGVVTCQVDADFDGITKEGDYQAEFKCVAGSTVLYFPKSIDGKRTYFTFKAQLPLDHMPAAARGDQLTAAETSIA